MVGAPRRVHGPRAAPMKRWSIAWLPMLGLVLALALGLWKTADEEPESGQAGGSGNVVDFLAAGDTEDFSRVEPGEGITFPEDHGAHPGFRQEWWYFTGNLRSESGRRFGIQLTFFRFAHQAFDEYRGSRWRHEQSWMAHLAVSDIAAGRLHAYQDYARGTLGLAGAEADPFAVWVNGWSVRSPESRGLQASLAARAGDVGIELDLADHGAPLLQGDQGYSVKDRRGETASYYYSLPNLAAHGTLVIGEDEFAITGEVWMDREWSTEVLSRDQTGWDWFALRLGGGAVLMVFQVRGTNEEPFRYGIHVGTDGRVRRFDADAIVIEPLRWWRSSSSGSRYPVSFRVVIEDAGIDLTVDAAFDAQELNLDFRYWEGVVNVAGSVDNVPVGGEGYMELTGY